MVSSMTGYGRAVVKKEEIEVTVEIRSVNNRFLDISLRNPRILADFEGQIKDIIAKTLSRGRINVSITVQSQNANLQTLTLNKPLATTYYRLVKELQQELDLAGEVALGQLLSLPDIIVMDENAPETELFWECTREALTRALDELQTMRRTEGTELLRDFMQRVENLEKMILSIESLSANRPREEIEKLRQRVHALIQEERVDEGRLEMELAFLSDRLDVTEECVRFHSHNKAFIQILQNEAAPGRKLNFLLQEMNREANTIGSKASSAEISHLVIEMKDEVEKLREQVQNIE